MPLGHVYVFLVKCLFRSSAHFLTRLFVFLILSSISCLYILEINPLSVVSLSKVFSHSEGCLFILFMVSFAVQKLLSLIKFHLFVFISITLGGGSKKLLLWWMSKSVFPMPSSKSFIVSGLTFKSLIHLELVFVYGVRECCYFILLHVAVQFSQHHLLRRLFFSTACSCLLCHNLDAHMCLALSLGNLSSTTDLYFCFCVSTILF